MMHPDLQVVSEQDEIVGSAPFKEVYANGLHHRVVRIVVEDGRGNMLLQKRNAKVDFYPDTWDVAAAGHVDVNEDYLIAAKRELLEEAGLQGVELQELGKQESHKQLEGRIINRFITVYKVIVEKNTQFDAHPDEVVELKWFAIDDVLRMNAEHREMLADGLFETLEAFY